jgi:hypothetical protein
MAELRRDTDFMSRHEQQEDERRRSLESYRTSARNVLADLAAVGFEVDTIGDLRHLDTPYLTAVPILVRWLPLVSDLVVKEDIVRTLSVPWAKRGGTATAHRVREG